MSLVNFLDTKTLFYDKIDYETIKHSWDILSKYITVPFVIHIVGTNGKGSTGRFLASFLLQNNKSVLHYSSPHIIKFNERIWIDGNDSSDDTLEFAHKKLQNILPKKLLDKLTYFEYTTLLALFLSSKKDFLVLEAGLGGEFDATNVIKNDLTIVPSIGLDHTEFLGDTIEQIAQTKLRSCDKAYILGKSVPKKAIEATSDILKDKEKITLNEYDITINLPQYLKDNLSLAYSVIEYLNLDISNLTIPKLFGRFQYYKNNIIIDVGHNPLAATVIKKQLENKKVILVYNSYKDKDFKEVLSILKPIIEKVQIIHLDDKRVVKKAILEDTLQLLDIKFSDFNCNIDDKKLYLIFGSFLVVERFLTLCK